MAVECGKDSTCQYKDAADSARYCRATSHVTCRRCKYYSPTNKAKLSYLMETVKALRLDNKKKDCQLEDLREKLKEANEEIKHLYAVLEEDDQYER